MSPSTGRADLDYPFAPPAPDGSAVEVAPGILWLRMPMPMALDHINVYLLRDDAGWTIVDTGLDTPRCRELWAHIEAEHLDGRPVTRLICTHNHYDHAGLAAWLMRRHGVPLLMSHGEFFVMRSHWGAPPDPLPELERQFYHRAGLTPAETVAMFDKVRGALVKPEVPASYQRLRDGDAIQLGARCWQVVIGEGHAPEHVCLYDAESRVLLAGDQLLPRITSNVLVSPVEPEANPLQLWLASLDRLGRLDPDTIVLPSHQGVFRGLHARVQELRHHHEQQFELLLGALDELGEATPADLMQRQFPERRHAFDDLMAIGETLAHLSCLRHRGALRRVLDDDGCHRFSRATRWSGPP